MAQVSIIPADSVVVVDGVGRSVEAMPADAVAGVPAAQIHAVQWDGAVGYVERAPAAGGGTVRFDEEGQIAPYLAAWTDAGSTSESD